MEFLTSGDFIAPFDFITYWIKHFFVWSFQTGAPNLDGIIRLPARVLNLIVFYFFGSLAMSYFYLFSTFVIAAASFFYFCRACLQTRSYIVCTLAALLFAFNPIFLGNIAKVGLVLAVAMLPLCITLIYKLFQHRNFIYVIPLFLALNVSLIHPFTFFVNVCLCLAYTGFLAFEHTDFVRKNLKKIIASIIFFFLLNAYFLLPLLAIGSIDKSVLSQEMEVETDYTSLISVANTDTILTGFSLSKNILLDFDFYNQQYKLVYLSVAFIFYIVLLFLYFRVRERLSMTEKRAIGFFLIGFLTLVGVAAVSILNVESILSFLANAPGGWMFRSPLKWQLYIPFFLFALIILILRKLSKKELLYAASVIAVIALLMNAYLIGDIYNKLLTPRNLGTFAALNEKVPNEKTMLYVDSADCRESARHNPEVFSELNVVLSSKQLQVKKVGLSDVDHYKPNTFDYILLCTQETTNELETGLNDSFTEIASFHEGMFALHQNTTEHDYVRLANPVYSLQSAEQLSSKQQFTHNTLGSDYDFILDPDCRNSLFPRFYRLFESLEVQNIRPDSLQEALCVTPSAPMDLYTNTQDSVINLEGDTLTISSGTAKEADDYEKIPIQTQENALHIDLQNIQFHNIIPNGSFEEGPWQPEVSDCYAYDNNPIMAMWLDKTQKTDGQQSLAFEAQRHIACTSITMPIEAQQNYLLAFDYMLENTEKATVAISYDSRNESQLKRLPSTTEWRAANLTLEPPQDAQFVTITLHAYPGKNQTQGTTYYDAFKLFKLPEQREKYYLLGNQPPHRSPEIDYQKINPTKTIVTAKNVTTPFVIASADTYHPKWQLTALPSASTSMFHPFHNVPSSQHFQLNNYQNAWYVDPQQFCEQQAVCQRNDNGSYTIELVMEFTPQRWFYLGLLISGVAFIGSLGYIVFRLFISHTRWHHADQKVTLGKGHHNDKT